MEAGTPAAPADVNLAGGLSAYGTMGQNGNVSEWTESGYYLAFRLVGGGSWGSSESELRSTFGNVAYSVGASFDTVGFRVANVLTAPTGPIVTTGAASDIASTSATLNGAVYPNGQATTAQFEYGTSTGYGGTASVPLSPNNGYTVQSVNVIIITLMPETLYHYRLTATNGTGSTNGVDQTFTTPPLDTDGDGIRDRYETGTGNYISPTDTGTSPTNRDTDGDGLDDPEEIDTYNTDPNVGDTDGDGFDDGFEVSTGFSPTSNASTPEALSAIYAAVEYRFNAAIGVSYRIEASADLTNWNTIEPTIIGNGGVITRFYSTVGQPKRFFRSRRN